MELDAMRAEEASQRTHEQWVQAVAASNTAFERQQRVIAERKKLIAAIRQVKQRSFGRYTSAAADSCMCLVANAR